MVIMAAADYERLVEAAEDAHDSALAERSRLAIERGELETLTSDEAKELLAAPIPLGFWRKKRGLTQGALSKASGVAQGVISEIEAGNKPGTAATLKKLADVLKLRIDDLV
ncbi:helix-turn-helix domain-containing protein [Bradyrhizobium oligotrophicum]|uniref:helix-turn-helix domain-containing protein n=1 Tax=Bradyrhizobium oligotrophicum TaxID=44255 RepID=UPI003EBD8AB6